MSRVIAITGEQRPRPRSGARIRGGRRSACLDRTRRRPPRSDGFGGARPRRRGAHRENRRARSLCDERVSSRRRRRDADRLPDHERRRVDGHAGLGRGRGSDEVGRSFRRQSERRDERPCAGRAPHASAASRADRTVRFDRRFRPAAGLALYAASKAAIVAFGLATRALYHADGVSVSVVCPGFVDTPMTGSYSSAKPFLVSAEDAARRIRLGLERRKAIIAFPWQLYLAARLQQFLPDPLRRRAMLRFRASARPPLAAG